MVSQSEIDQLVHSSVKWMMHLCNLIKHLLLFYSILVTCGPCGTVFVLVYLLFFLGYFCVLWLISTCMSVPPRYLAGYPSHVSLLPSAGNDHRPQCSDVLPLQAHSTRWLNAVASKTKAGLSRGESGRFWEYNNFHLCIALWKLLRPPVACYAEAAFVRPRATCL